MKLDKIFLWFIGVLLSFNGVLSLSILAIFPYQGKSHFFVFEPYLKELAARGHNMTVISYFPQQQSIKNYYDISLAGKSKVLESAIPIHRSYWSIVRIVLFLSAMGRENCEILLEDENVQNLWQTDAKFDLVVTEQFNNDCSLGLAYKLKAPVVGLTSHTMMPWHYNRLGIKYHPAYMIHQFLEGSTTPTLYERVERFVVHNFIKFVYKYTCQRVNQNQLAKHFYSPPLEDLAGNIKLLMVYTNFVLNGPGLYPPNVVEVGGYHVAKPKSLPKDLREFIENAEHGVIYISFGSMLQSASTPKNKLDAILATLSELPQKVVWKWDTDLPGNPENVYVSSWLPQNDILAHPKVLAFFSHCGMLSTTEAIYHGVPIIGMPIFGDQPGNAGAIVESGLGVQIQIQNLNKDDLIKKIKTVLKPEFREKVKELSRAWHDRPMSPMDTAVYWTEFAARNKNFTFRSPAATVPMYQYLYLDVILVLGIFLYISLHLLKFSMWFLIRKTTKTLIYILSRILKLRPKKTKTK